MIEMLEEMGMKGWAMHHLIRYRMMASIVAGELSIKSTFLTRVKKFELPIELEFLEVLVFVEGGKPESPEKNTWSRDENRQQSQPAYDAHSTGELNPGHVGGKRVLSPLRYPCSPQLLTPCLSACLSACPSVRPSVRLSVQLSN